MFLLCSFLPVLESLLGGFENLGVATSESAPEPAMRSIDEWYHMSLVAVAGQCTSQMPE